MIWKPFDCSKPPVGRGRACNGVVWVRLEFLFDSLYFFFFFFLLLFSFLVLFLYEMLFHTSQLSSPRNVRGKAVLPWEASMAHVQC